MTAQAVRSAAPIVDVAGLRKVFRPHRSLRGNAEPIVAVDDVSFTLEEGRSLAIVGESGSGKTTVARMLVGLEQPSAGVIRVAGRVRQARGRLSRLERRLRGREIQIVFQDPYSSLDPRQRAQDCIGEVLRFYFGSSGTELSRRVAALLDQVGLDGRLAAAYPREMSGGQRQRLAIARALAAEPRVIVLDEAVAALDVSIRAQILNLLADIRDATAVSLVFISHDLSVVRRVADTTIVMRHGQVVERGDTTQVLGSPEHPYTQWLLASVPRPGWTPDRAARMSLLFRDPEG